jgi:hypothetical protein
MHRSSKKLDTIIASTENQTEFFNGIEPEAATRLI